MCVQGGAAQSVVRRAATRRARPLAGATQQGSGAAGHSGLTAGAAPAARAPLHHGGAARLVRRASPPWRALRTRQRRSWRSWTDSRLHARHSRTVTPWRRRSACVVCRPPGGLCAQDSGAAGDPGLTAGTAPAARALLHNRSAARLVRRASPPGGHCAQAAVQLMILD